MPPTTIYLAVEGSWEYNYSYDEIIGAYGTREAADIGRAAWLARKRAAKIAGFTDAPGYNYADMTKVLELPLLQ